MNTRFEHPRLGAVTLSRNPCARRISISVRGTETIRLTFPAGVPQAQALAFLDSRIDWIERVRTRMAEREAALPPSLPPEQERMRIETLRRAAKEDLPLRIERLARQSGLKYAKLSIRASRTKWGSCSGENHISLSLFLMILPEHLRDYVIVHELCHTVHHDHSPRFHALLDRLTGGRDKALSRELRAYTIRG